MKIKLTPAFVMRATADPACADGKPNPDAERTTYWDKTMPGFGLMVTKAGHRSFVVQYRANRISRRMTIDGTLDLSKARKLAKALQGDVAHDRDPLAERRTKEAEAKRKAEAATNTLKSVAENYFSRDGKNLRSLKNRRRVFEKDIFPKLGSLPIDAIRCSDVVRLLDHVEDKSGPAAADQVLAFLRKVMSWHASRSDEFRSPIVRGMARTKPGEQARERTLTDDELRAVWAAAATESLYGALIRFLLLTGARRDEARNTCYLELEDGVWTLPALRHKTGKTIGDLVRPLSKAAQAVLAEVPVGGPFVFSDNGRAPIGAMTKRKARFDKVSGVTGWRVHDLRRTARSLMSRAGVDADIAERCLGHVIGGVRGVYDRHSFLEEKRIAFEKLAALIEGIVNPQPKVLPFIKVSGETRK